MIIGHIYSFIGVARRGRFILCRVWVAGASRSVQACVCGCTEQSSFVLESSLSSRLILNQPTDRYTARSFNQGVGRTGWVVGQECAQH